MQFVAVGFSLFGVQWVMHSSVRGYLLSWGGSSVRKKKGLECCSIMCVLDHMEGEK